MNRLLDRWTTPVDARAMLATINPAWGSQPTGTISDLSSTDDTTTVTLAIRRATTRELVGTSAAIGVELAGVRTFTDVDLRPTGAGTFQFSIDRSTDDRVLTHLATHGAIGDTIHIGLVDDAAPPATPTTGTTVAGPPATTSTSPVTPTGRIAAATPTTHAHHFRASDVRADVDEGTSILEAAEAEGLDPRFGCRRGNCRRCVVPLTSGTVTDLRTGRTTEHGTHIQVCVNTAASDVAVEL